MAASVADLAEEQEEGQAVSEDEQQQWRKGGAFADALATFQSECPTVPKNKKANAGTYSYAYADLADIAEVAYPLLAKQGLAFTCKPRDRQLVGKLIHVSGEFEEGELPIQGRTMQEIGSSITYGRRYLFGCLTGIVTDADDDGAAASAKPKARKPQPQQQEAPHGDKDRRTEQQSKLLAIQMKKAGLTDREEALAYFGGLVGRTVESTTTLTKAEASKIIDTLINANSEGVNPTTGAITTKGQIDATNTDPWTERQ
jgi:hypothetical protein